MSVDFLFYLPFVYNVSSFIGNKSKSTYKSIIMNEDRIAPVFKGRHIFLTGGNELFRELNMNL